VNLPTLHLTRRTGMIAAVTAAVVGFGGLALAEGGVPIVSSGSETSAATSDPSSTTTTAPGAPGASTDNVAVAVNTTDGRTVYAISLKIVQTDAETIDAANAAVAVASCADCQTVAIALEGVLVIGDPTNFEPTNIALAINSGCTSCQTLASAYQHIVQNDTRVRISGEGRREIAAVRAGLQSLRPSGLDIFAIQAAVDEYAARLVHVLNNEVYPIGRPPAPSTTTTATPGSTTSSTTITTVATESTSSSTTSTSAPETTTTTGASTATTAAP
jgi:putative peptide zinc metalloprotease protein